MLHTTYVYRSKYSHFPLQWPGFEPGSCHVGFVVDKVALEQDSFEIFSFRFSHSTGCSTRIIIHHPGLVQKAKQWPTYQVDSASPQPNVFLYSTINVEYFGRCLCRHHLGFMWRQRQNPSTFDTKSIVTWLIARKIFRSVRWKWKLYMI
jgi:hypothetical protein